MDGHSGFVGLGEDEVFDGTINDLSPTHGISFAVLLVIPFWGAVVWMLAAFLAQ